MSYNIEYFILIPKEIRIMLYYILISSSIYLYILPLLYLILLDKLEEIKGILYPILTLILI